jgi:prepilin-type N-terminal cleavage/methylation domain-containing protein
MTPLRSRAGFTLVEVLIALTLTAVLGAAVMGAFVSQTRFFDHQEKVGAARAVSRGALNIMMSEMRMIERGGGMVSATNQQVSVRVPYMFGLVCSSTGGVLTITTLPADVSGVSGIPFSGYAYRTSTGAYTYMENPLTATTPGATLCAAAGLVPASGGVISGGKVIAIPLGPSIPVATPVFLYHIVTYSFGASTSVPGRTALFRQVDGAAIEELIAPFDTTARFRFFDNDAAVAQNAVPSPLSNTTGIEIVLDAMSERPNRDGTFQRVPLTTAVHFRNR